jgi:transposase-like protein
MLEQDHQTIKQQIRPRQEFKRFAFAARFCSAHNEIPHFFRFPLSGRRPPSLRWHCQLRHHQFTIQQKMTLAV